MEKKAGRGGKRQLARLGESLNKAKDNHRLSELIDLIGSIPRVKQTLRSDGAPEDS